MIDINLKWTIQLILYNIGYPHVINVNFNCMIQLILYNIDYSCVININLNWMTQVIFLFIFHKIFWELFRIYVYIYIILKKCLVSSKLELCWPKISFYFSKDGIRSIYFNYIQIEYFFYLTAYFFYYKLLENQTIGWNL